LSEEIQLKVAEVGQSDAGRDKALMDNESMRALGIVAEDMTELRGERTAAAVAWPAYQEDEGKGIIRIDGLIRKNAGVRP